MKPETHKSVPLFNLNEISSGNIPEEYASYAAELTSFSNWVKDFLAKSNIDLGRTGAVCPYVQYAEERGFFRVGIYGEPEPSEDFVTELILNMRDYFITMLPVSKKDEKFKAITILFPNLKPAAVASLIDGVQLKLKPAFVKQGLMIGQFYENCQEGGLRNSNFRPLQSPIPLLAIRNMVETDWPFLEGDPVMENAYNSNFGKINFGAKIIEKKNGF